MIDSLQCIDWQIPQYTDCVIGRFFNLCIVQLADSSVYRFTDSAIYGLCSWQIPHSRDWQIPQFKDSQIQQSMDSVLGQFHTLGIDRCINLWIVCRVWNLLIMLKNLSICILWNNHTIYRLMHLWIHKLKNLSICRVWICQSHNL